MALLKDHRMNGKQQPVPRLADCDDYAKQRENLINLQTRKADIDRQLSAAHSERHGERVGWTPDAEKQVRAIRPHRRDPDQPRVDALVVGKPPADPADPVLDVATLQHERGILARAIDDQQRVLAETVAALSRDVLRRAEVQAAYTVRVQAVADALRALLAASEAERIWYEAIMAQGFEVASHLPRMNAPAIGEGPFNLAAVYEKQAKDFGYSIK